MCHCIKQLVVVVLLLSISLGCNTENKDGITYLKKNMLFPKKSLLSNSVYNFLRDGDSIWISDGYFTAGLSKYNIKKNEIINYNSFNYKGKDYQFGGIKSMLLTEKYICMTNGFDVFFVDRESNNIVKIFENEKDLFSNKVCGLFFVGEQLYVGYFDFGYSIIDINNLSLIKTLKLLKDKSKYPEPMNLYSIFEIIKINNTFFINTFGDGIYINSCEKKNLINGTEGFNGDFLENVNNELYFIGEPFDDKKIKIFNIIDNILVQRNDLDGFLKDGQTTIGSFYKIDKYLVYAVSQLGICFKNLKNGEIKIISDKSILPDRFKFIYSFCFDGEYFWIGTPEDGAVMVTKKKMFELLKYASKVTLNQKIK